MTDQKKPTDKPESKMGEVPEGLEFPSRSKLEDQLTAMEMQLEEYKEKSIRAHAELENMHRRAQRDVEKAHKYAVEKLLVDMLPVLDGLELGLSNAAENDPHAEGMKLTREILLKTLIKHGMNVIAPKKGETFNPEQHQAMTMAEDPDLDANKVIQVLQNGYELNGRVLRPAMVIVSK